MKIYCCNYEKELDCELVKGSVVYPLRQDLSHLNFYRCPKCKQYIDCHPNSTRPLGVIPTQQMKKSKNDYTRYDRPSLEKRKNN